MWRFYNLDPTVQMLLLFLIFIFKLKVPKVRLFSKKGDENVCVRCLMQEFSDRMSLVMFNQNYSHFMRVMNCKCVL